MTRFFHCAMSSKPVCLLAIGALLVVFLPSLGRAQALNRDERGCIDKMSRRARVLVAAHLQRHADCIQDAMEGSLPAGQSVGQCAMTDPSGRIASAEAKLARVEEDRCTDDIPSFGFEDADRQGDIAEATSKMLVEDIFGGQLGPDLPAFPKLEFRCERAVSRILGKLVQTRLDSIRDCVNYGTRDATILSSSGLADCVESALATAAGRIDRAHVKLGRILGNRCDGLDLDVLFPGESCEQSDTGQLADCFDDRADCHVCQMASKMLGAYADVDCDLADDSQANGSCPVISECPVAFRITTRSRGGSPGSVTRVSTGHLGLTHHVDVPGGYSMTVGTTCGAAWPCAEDCTVTGILEPMGRCRLNPAISCDTINGVDLDDCGPDDTCQYHPFLPRNALYSDLCLEDVLESDLTGTINPRTGAVSLEMDLRTYGYLSVSHAADCPLCGGDPQPNDGSAGGVCIGGQRNGLACDVNGIDPDAGPMSLDCSPNLASMAGAGAHLTKHYQLRTETATLPFAVPCDPPYQGLMCPCGLCSGDPTVPCRSDAECAGVGTCTATSVSPAVPRVPNECANGYPGYCQDRGDGLGTCDYQAVYAGCDGFVDSEGNFLLGGCGSAADCAAMCPFADCGSCDLQDLSCLPDPIVANGAADSNSPVLADVTCVAPTQTYGVLNTDGGGLPGAERVLLSVYLEQIH